MSRKKKPEIKESDLQGFKYFKTISKLLEHLHSAGTARDKAGNRNLHMDQYMTMLLLGMTAYEVTGTDWAENSLTAENDTNVWGNALDTVAPVLVDEWYEFDVTSWITGNGYFTLGLRTTDSRKKIYMKESGTGPELIL